jgi:hypothetical protein
LQSCWEVAGLISAPTANGKRPGETPCRANRGGADELQQFHED